MGGLKKISLTATAVLLVCLAIFSINSYLDEKNSITVTKITSDGSFQEVSKEPIARKEVVIEPKPAEKTPAPIEIKKTKKKTASSETATPEPVVENVPLENSTQENFAVQEAPPIQITPPSSAPPQQNYPTHAKIFPEVIEEMNKNGKARVIISLEEGRGLGLHKDEFEFITEIYGINAVAGILTKAAFDKIKLSPDIKIIEIDRPLQIATAESFPLTNIDIVKNVTVNGVGINGTGQTVCVIDTGVAYGHAELGNCTGTEYLAGNCTKVIGGYDFFNSDNNPADDSGHGTSIAGLIAADGPTYKGIAPGAKIVALKISNNFGAGWTSYAAAAINWCTNNASTYNITTISFAFSDGTQNTGTACDGGVVDNAVAAANAKNISVFAPAGNNGFTAGISFPACVTRVISTSAIRDGTLGSQFTDTFWMFSNRGSILDLLAPGYLITILGIPTGTGNAGGTSFAMAHAVGSDILIRQYNQLRYNVNPDPTYIKNALTLTGFNITDNSTGGSNLTFPRIDLVRAVNYETLQPVITLISPANYTKVIPPGNVNFTYNVTDHHEILNCDLYINNVLNQTDTTVQLSTTETFSLSNLASGSYTWQVKCWDNATFSNQGSSSTWTYRVNSPPTISSIPTQTIAEDSGTNNADLTSYINDNDADSLTMTILAENTAQVDCGTSGLTLTMTPASNYNGPANCTIKVNDGQQDSNNVTVTINVTSVNDAPVITSTAVTSASIGTQYTYTVTATDVENDQLTYSLTTFPMGMAINSTTGVITWTPVSGQQGNNNIVVQVSDGNGGTPTQSFTINVANAQPVITTTAITSASIGTQYVYDVNATDADLDTLTYSLTTFPAGMNINSATGLITWIPTPAQRTSHLVTAQVTDPYSGSTTQSFNISVGNNNPVITSSPPTSTLARNPYTYQITASDPDADTLVYSLNQNPLGMTINSNTLTWNPGFSDLGSHQVEVQVNDSYGGVDIQQFTLQVAQNLGGTITSCEYGPMNGGELGENKCTPPPCPNNYFSLLLNEHHISGQSHYNRVYRICLNEITNAHILSCENNCDPGVCPSGTTSIGDIEEIHAANTITRNYRICVDQNQFNSGEITSCYSDGNLETNRCIAPQCNNKVSIGEITDIRPIYGDRGRNTNWKFISYRICIE